VPAAGLRIGRRLHCQPATAAAQAPPRPPAPGGPCQCIHSTRYGIMSAGARTKTFLAKKHINTAVDRVTPVGLFARGNDGAQHGAQGRKHYGMPSRPCPLQVRLHGLRQCPPAARKHNHVDSMRSTMVKHHLASLRLGVMEWDRAFPVCFRHSLHVIA
jgi:hypothetical protein